MTSFNDVQEGTIDMRSWPKSLRLNSSLLSSDEIKYARLLVSLGQQHIFSDWDEPDINDELKHKFFGQVKLLDGCYAGGLTGYISKARSLLKSTAEGLNPLNGWLPQIPDGVILQPVTAQYESFEYRGLSEIGYCGFILVAGGLGERLGYSGIKVELPTETITGVCYLELYCRQILAMERRGSGLRLPLAIMVSEDTHDRTVALLAGNDYYGLDKSQVTILRQGKVPALKSNAAEIATIDAYTIEGSHCCQSSVVTFSNALPNTCSGR